MLNGFKLKKMIKERIFELAQRTQVDSRIKSEGLKLMSGLQIINNRLDIHGMGLFYISLRTLSKDGNWNVRILGENGIWNIAELEESALGIIVDFISVERAGVLLDESTLKSLFELGFYPCPVLETISFRLS